MRGTLRLVATCLSGVACSIAATGCGDAGGDGQRLEQEMEKLVSAARTTSMVAREWSGGRVPDVYAAQMARIVGEQLERERAQPIWSQADPQIRQTALTGAVAARRLAERLEEVVAQEDVGGAASLAVESADLARELGQLTDRSGS
jgi:hypothetical protein